MPRPGVPCTQWPGLFRLICGLTPPFAARAFAPVNSFPLRSEFHWLAMPNPSTWPSSCVATV